MQPVRRRGVLARARAAGQDIPMRKWGWGLTLALVLCGSGCGRDYPMSFKCDDHHEDLCPTGAECPEVPLDSSSCGELPGLFGHEPIPTNTARPMGCVVELPYGNPNYGDDQQGCICQSMPDGTAGWACPV
jgi:hypothetical protein